MGQVMQWCAVLILCSAVSGEIECTVETSVGDISLYDYGRERSNYQGMVNVCTKLPNGGYGWVAVCFGGDSTFNEGAAAASCRQAGYITQQDYGSTSRLPFGTPSDVNYCINQIQCPNVKNYSLHGETVLLRCVYSFPTVCNCSDKAAVVCDKTLVYNGKVAYNGQVYRQTTQNSFMVYIYLEGKSLPICMDETNQTVGNSICQQLGYTQAFLVEPMQVQEEESWYFENQVCGSEPYACFTDCFNTSAYTNVTCTNSKTGIEVYCVYNETQSSLYGSGSKGLCEIYVSCPADSIQIEASLKRWKISTIVLAVFLAVFFVPSSVLVFTALRWTYQKVKNLQWNHYERIFGVNQPGINQLVRGDEQDAQGEGGRNEEAA